MARARWLRMTRTLSALLAVLLVLAACGGDDPGEPEVADDADEPAAEPETDEEPDEEPDEAEDDGEFRQLVVDSRADHETGDPHQNVNRTGRFLANSLYDTLLTFDPEDLSVEPRLAESFEVSDDAMTFTFVLRDDAVFSDGAPVTADDVVFSLYRLKHLQSGVSSLVAGLDFRAEDDRTVVVESESPNLGVPAVMASPATAVVNSAVVEANGGTSDENAVEVDEAQTFLDGESAGSGPYVLVNFSRESDTILEFNENYWGPRPHYDRIVFRNIEPAGQRLNVMSGEADIALDLSQDDLGGVEDAGIEVNAHPSLQVFYIEATANEEASEVTSNPDFWEAVRYGMDYDDLLELAGEGAVQACGVLPRQYAAGLPEGECIERDVDRARAAVERLGVGEPEVTIEYPTDFGVDGLEFGVVAQRIQVHLEEVGIHASLEGAPLAPWLDRWRDPTLQEMNQASIDYAFPDPVAIQFMLPGGRRGVYAGWEVGDAPEVDAQAEVAMTSTDEDERIEAFRELQRLINEQGPMFPQFQATTYFVHSPDIEGVRDHPVYLLVFD